MEKTSATIILGDLFSSHFFGFAFLGSAEDFRGCGGVLSMRLITSSRRCAGC
jgi:hypothetical protein